MSRNTFAAPRAASCRIRKTFLLAGLLTAGGPAALGQDLYWVESATVIRRQTAAGVEDLVSSQNEDIRDLVLDTQSRQMYWSESGMDLSDSVKSRIRRANLDGTGVVDLVAEPVETYYPTYDGRPPSLARWNYPRYMRGLTLDLVNRKLYWLQAADVLWGCDERNPDYSCLAPAVRSADLDGSNPVTIATLSQSYPASAAVAFDPQAGKIYWSRGLYNAFTPYILRANFDGSDLQYFLSELSFPRDFNYTEGVPELALDLPSQKLYWLELQKGTYAIRRANLDGATPPETLLRYSIPLPGHPFTLPIRLSVDPVCGRVYWTTVESLDVCYGGWPRCAPPLGPGLIFATDFSATSVAQVASDVNILTAVAVDRPDADSDGTPDCQDACPTDPAKTAPGLCDCGQPDTDTDSDGTLDCQDEFPNGEPDNSGDGGAAAAARTLLANCGIGAASAAAVTLLGLVQMRRRRMPPPCNLDAVSS